MQSICCRVLCAAWFSDACFHLNKRMSGHLVCKESVVLFIKLYFIKAKKFSQCPLNKCSKSFWRAFATHMKYEWLTYTSKICVSDKFLNQIRPSVGYGVVRVCFSTTIAKQHNCNNVTSGNWPMTEKTVELQLGWVFWAQICTESVHIVWNNVHSWRPAWSLWYASVWEWWRGIPFWKRRASRCTHLSLWKGGPLCHLDSSCPSFFSVRFSTRNLLWKCLAKHRNNGV